ncbi:MULTISPECIES: hypothetical protein [Agrobacterium]|uniref:hypothetical protein n=1 Tax=Agrobacterium TaxID=357 RepID=UPI001571D8BF|nr:MULTISPECIES: hypothetical protein [Agrobacterium]MCD4660801.1 hypothetical protein [Agrobacterium sp.]NTE54357.1 hypothetical protein [Agrobacterium tumefaciens]NTE70522.1 hypothetical protein [Agrobacterium tumefaciens]
MADPITTDQFIRIVEGQARIAEKLDLFIQSQNSMKAELDAIKSDVASIKSTNASYKSYIQGALGLFSVFWIGATLFVVPLIQRKLGL